MYHPLFSRSFGRLTDELEETFWGKFDEVHQSHEHGSVSSLQYSSDGILMSVWKHAIVLYSSNMNSVITKLSSDQGFHASHFRGDGKIFAVSEGPEGRLGIYTLGGRCIQRFKNQNDVVNCLEFSGKSHVVSWSGDGTITRSEVATGSLEHKFLEPDVSRGICSPFSENIIISGCSNGNVKIGDWRNCASMNIYNTKNQIYSATFISEDLIALGCAGDLHLVDLRMRLPLNVLRPHSKCISGLCTLSNRQHLTTVSYDRTFKVFDSTHGFDIIYTSSTATTGYTSVASNISNTEFSFGFEDGFVRRQRRSPENTRSKYVEIKDHSVTKPIDQCLKGYEHAKALKLAVKNQTENSKTLKCDVIFSLLQELIHRNAIRTALSGWNETELYALLNYLIPFCRHKSRTDIIVTVIELCLEVYAEAISLSTKIMRLLSVLRNDLEAHILNMSNMTTLESILDVLIESNYLSV